MKNPRAAAIAAALAMLLPAATCAQQGAGIDLTSRLLQPDTDRVVYFVAPAATDPSILKSDDNVVIYRHSTPASAPLLVFLPPTFGHPVKMQLILDSASRAGYRVIGLAYDDAPSADTTCTDGTDPLCFEKFRRKRIYGVNDTDVIHDAPQDAIYNRLLKLLEYLNGHYPHDGWNSYLSNGAPNWARIAVGGHSQGAGMAAFIAKEHAVYRVAMFSSPWDYFSSNQQFAPWMSSRPATPVDRWFGAYHAQEPQAARLARAFATLGLAASHVCRMNLPARSGRATVNPETFHNSVAYDPVTPLAADGSPAYAPAWSFVFGAPSSKGAVTPPRPPVCNG